MFYNILLHIVNLVIYIEIKIKKITLKV